VVDRREWWEDCVFADRTDAGRRLADALASDAATSDAAMSASSERPVVVALPRGGVLVAAPVARRLGTALDVMVVRKLGCPWQPELGVGAIAEDGVRVLNEPLIGELGMTDAQVAEVTARETIELARRSARYRDGREPVDVRGRTVILVDDGVATGFTVRAAIEAVRGRGARLVILAVPVASDEAITSLRSAVDAVVVLEVATFFFGLSEFYDDFHAVSDEEVLAALDARVPSAGPGPPGR
jgi:predicted phosphoribosyltransferase